MSAAYRWDGLYVEGAAEHDQCAECGLPHTPERRRAVLRRMLPATSPEILRAWPHLWPETDTGRRALNRDLRALGAVPDAGAWRLP
jgi:hypothetical protein